MLTTSNKHYLSSLDLPQPHAAQSRCDVAHTANTSLKIIKMPKFHKHDAQAAYKH